MDDTTDTVEQTPGWFIENAETFADLPQIVKAAHAAKDAGAILLRVSVDEEVVRAYPVFARSSGPVMVCLDMSVAEDAVRAVADTDDPVDHVHLTLAYLGNTDDLSIRDLAATHAAVADLARWTGAFEGVLGGLGSFPAGDAGVPVWVPFDAPSLGELRHRLMGYLQEWGVSVSEAHGFTPHVTVGYISGASVSIEPMEAQVVSVDAIHVAVAGDWTSYRFGEESPTVSESGGGVAMTKERTAKALDQRFTLAPWYIPGTVDAHDEWTDSDEVQQALWGYVESGDRDIRLQHDNDILAGRWVEAMSWPHEVTVPMYLDGEVRQQTFPAGTVFLGVVWESWAWELVKMGAIRGYSIGGKAKRVTVDMPTE
jgi:2'-5' RNA ligase